MGEYFKILAHKRYGNASPSFFKRKIVFVRIILQEHCKK
jgi:hypothetical protein